jgi:glucan 1,3-beta-glucosidase
MTPIDRRTFLRSAAILGAGATLGLGAPAPPGPEPRRDDPPKAPHWRGVNLGGWLALERWITPSVYQGTEAPDEYELCKALGPAKAKERLLKHRDDWIKAEDFAWLGDRGINAVRLPINHGAAIESPPFVPAWDAVERCFRQANEHGIGVLLDLHGVPGSQNGWDHSGRQGELGWHTSRDNLDRSLAILEDLARRIRDFPNALGIELVNEPRWDVPLDILKSFYRDAYARVRDHLGADKAVVFHDAFRPDAWADFMQPPEFANVLIDTHPYQVFTEDDRKRTLAQQVEYALNERRKLVDGLQRHFPCIVGEWSCALPGESLAGLEGFRLDVATRAYGDAQLINYEAARGWFFWTYRTEDGGGWSFRDCVERGWLPPRFDA